MDREEIIRMAREAGCIPRRHPEYDNDIQVFATPDVLERFADLVAKAERHRIYEMLIKMHTQEERHNYYMFIANIIKESA